MKNRISKLFLLVMFGCLSLSFLAQTQGTLTFSFLPVTKSPGYQGTRNVLAVWIQTDVGGFIKTKFRYAGGNTSDHLPTWAVNAGGPANNCLNAACNKTDATTGATLPTFSAKSFTWDGKGVNGTANGTVVADGIYKVSIEETWNHGTGGTTVSSYTFTKGPNIDSQLPPDNAYFTGVFLEWVPTPTVSDVGISENTANAPKVSVFPNPTKGELNISYINASDIQVINTLGMVVYAARTEETARGQKNINLSEFANGIYMIRVSNSTGTTHQKVVLNK